MHLHLAWNMPMALYNNLMSYTSWPLIADWFHYWLMAGLIDFQVYTGVANQGFIQPQTLASQDIVVTMYETLRKELNYVDLPHTNSKKLFLQLPLTSIFGSFEIFFFFLNSVCQFALPVHVHLASTCSLNSYFFEDAKACNFLLQCHVKKEYFGIWEHVNYFMPSLPCACFVLDCIEGSSFCRVIYLKYEQMLLREQNMYRFSCYMYTYIWSVFLIVFKFLKWGNKVWWLLLCKTTLAVCTGISFFFFLIIWLYLFCFQVIWGDDSEIPKSSWLSLLPSLQ